MTESSEECKVWGFSFGYMQLCKKAIACWQVMIWSDNLQYIFFLKEKHFIFPAVICTEYSRNLAFTKQEDTRCTQFLPCSAALQQYSVHCGEATLHFNRGRAAKVVVTEHYNTRLLLEPSVATMIVRGGICKDLSTVACSYLYGLYLQISFFFPPFPKDVLHVRAIMAMSWQLKFK